jgi:hypothetical protein
MWNEKNDSVSPALVGTVMVLLQVPSLALSFQAQYVGMRKGMRARWFQTSSAQYSMQLDFSNDRSHGATHTGLAGPWAI